MRYPNGEVQGGSYVNGKRHGQWLAYGRRSDGSNEYALEATFTRGEKQKDWSRPEELSDINEACRDTCAKTFVAMYNDPDQWMHASEQRSQCDLECLSTSRTEIIRRVKAELRIN